MMIFIYPPKGHRKKSVHIFQDSSSCVEIQCDPKVNQKVILEQKLINCASTSAFIWCSHSKCFVLIRKPVFNFFSQFIFVVFVHSFSSLCFALLFFSFRVFAVILSAVFVVVAFFSALKYLERVISLTRFAYSCVYVFGYLFRVLYIKKYTLRYLSAMYKRVVLGFVWHFIFSAM